MHTVGSVCTGYGGLDAGVRDALGGDLRWVADPDPDAARILAHHHPDVPAAPAGGVMSKPRLVWPEHCGRPDCDPTTRMVEHGDDKLPARCPCVRRANDLAGMHTERAALTARLAELDERISAAEVDVPPWITGPVRR